MGGDGAGWVGSAGAGVEVAMGAWDWRVAAGAAGELATVGELPPVVAVAVELMAAGVTVGDGEPGLDASRSMVASAAMTSASAVAGGCAPAKPAQATANPARETPATVALSAVCRSLLKPRRVPATSFISSIYGVAGAGSAPRV